MWRRRNYRRSVESIVDELRFLKVRYGKAEFEFTDETFVLHPGVIVDFCGELAAKRVDVAWSCTGRVNLVDAPLLDEMAAHGCRGIFYGIESGSDRVLERIRKDFTVREAIDVVHESLKRVHVVASFVWGYPFESVDDLLRTMIIMAYFSRLGVDTRLNRLIPFARTELYAEYGDALVPRDGTHAFSPTVPFQERHRRRDRRSREETPAGVPGILLLCNGRLCREIRARRGRR
jgi:radical SAM superfamily enzyme YgiQ (UPF0313 family)